MFGNVYLNDEMMITKIIEKPRMGTLGNYVLSGVFILPTTFFSVLRENEKNMERALAYLVNKGELAASIWEDEWIDVAYPWDILRANQIIMDSWRSAYISGSVRFIGEVRIEGPVYIEDDVEIRSGTIVMGPSYIGAGSFIGNNVLIRKYTSIGPESAIGYGVELKNCILFGRTKIGRLSFIGDSVMGHNVDIGSGTMTVNRELDGNAIKARVNGRLIDTHLLKLGAFVGDDVNIGASNTILAGTIIKFGTNIPHHHSYLMF
jgi:bifunctional UDP-N-acetylglucosamine pyrophosphorylase/glucosamine-1-phosphate N-acetyltransferase